MKKQIDLFLTAIMFFTRLPVPDRIDHSDGMLQKSSRYFTWVGIVVGIIAAASFACLRQVFSPALSTFFSMIISVLATGGFHEDGFADVCDAFGGGWTKEKILMIMKDSRLGTYGVIGLISILGLKYILLLELTDILGHRAFAAILIAAHSLSRFAAITVLQQYKYVSDTQGSKSKPLANRKLNTGEMAVAIAGGFLPFIFIHYKFLGTIILVSIPRFYLGKYFYKWIGGYTGDCLGATQQVCEVSFYLAVLMLWRFI